MKRKITSSILMCLIIGAGAGMLASNALARISRADEQSICSAASRIQLDAMPYILSFRTATPLDGQVLYLELDGEPFAEVEIPNTGTWTNFVDAVSEEIVFPVGSEGAFRITYDREHLLFGSVSFIPVGK